jgi:hypothetical protein
MKKINTIIWASNLSAKTGEGILARKFLEFFLEKNKISSCKIKTNEQEFIFKNKKNYPKIIEKNNILHKYFGPLYGVFYLFLNRKKNIIFVNYLPLWNFLIFLFLPSNTILGPITGGVYNGKIKNLNFFVRKYIFPILYKISIFLIYCKFKKVIFSNSLLKIYVPKKFFSRTLFNFVLINFNHRKTYDSYNKKKKDFDFIFYNNNHETKYDKDKLEIINKLSFKYKVCAIGDFYDNVRIANFGYVERKIVYKLLSRSKIAINSSENFYSLFAIDAVNCGTPLLYDINSSKCYNDISNYYLPFKLNLFFNNNRSLQKIFNLNIIDTIFEKKIALFKKTTVPNFILIS